MSQFLIGAYNTLFGNSQDAAFTGLLQAGADATGISYVKKAAEKALAAKTGDLIHGSVEGLKVTAYKEMLTQAFITPVDIFFGQLVAESGKDSALLTPVKQKLSALKAECKNADATFASLSKCFEESKEELTKLLSEGRLFVQNRSFVDPTAVKSSLTAAPVVEKPVERSREAYIEEIKSELHNFRNNLTRQIQLKRVFGNKLPASLKNYSSLSPQEYSRTINLEINRKASLSSHSFIVRPLLAILDRIQSFVIGLIVNYYLNKITSAIIYRLDNLDEKQDAKNKSAILDTVYDTIINGLHTYSSQLIACINQLDVKSKQPGSILDGTPDKLLAEALKEKVSLRGDKKTEKEFYQACFSGVLDQIFIEPTGWFKYLKKIQQIFDRFIITFFVSKTGYLDDPFKIVADTTQAQNGLTYQIDKAIIACVRPLLEQMDSKTLTDDSISSSSLGLKSHFYSEARISQLKLALQSLFRSSTTLGLADIGFVQQKAEDLRKPKSPLSTDKILYETSESAALAILDALDGAIKEKNYFFYQGSQLLKLLNGSFIEKGDEPYVIRAKLVEAENALGFTEEGTPERATAEAARDAAKDAVDKLDREISKAERERNEVLLALSKKIIGKAIKTLPSLNPQISHEKMNSYLSQVKVFADEFTTCIDSNLEALEAKINGLDERVGHEKGLNIDEKEAVQRALGHLKSEILKYKLSEEEAKASVRDAMTDYLRDDANSVYEPKVLAAIGNSSLVKGIGQLISGMVVEHELKKLYPFFIHPLTLKYFVAHQSIKQVMKA